MKKILFIALVTSLAFSWGCYYDNVEELTAGNLPTACDTLDSAGTAARTIRFNSDVLPIFVARCGTNSDGCHSANGNGGLEDYIQTMATIDDADLRSKPLLGRIKHESSLNQSYWMPPNGEPKLDDCSIAKIQLWIDQGKLDN